MLKEVLIYLFMMFSEKEINQILQKFPKFELCYEKMTHKKVHGSSAMLAIPEGNKGFAWFTSYNNNNVCFFLEINKNRQIVNVKQLTTSFIDKLSLGTIFYGTIIQNNPNLFCVEDIYYYAGKSFYNYSYYLKLQKLKNIFENEISQFALVDKFTIFGLPLILNDLQLIVKHIQLLPYNISEIKFRFFENEYSKKILYMKYYKPGTQKNNNNLQKKAIFKIMPDIEPDIYNLFIYNNGKEEYYDIAFIPDYKTSVMMNKLFRNIKENENLDAIEESDDEEEFENSREDKYVYLDRYFKINCEYNSKFNRWVPISLAGQNDKITTYNMI
jgi:hypothetical protein